MLACSISQRAPRAAIAADLFEVAAAADANTTGNIIFATLVDDPASVDEIVDAYLGEIMLEAASAVDTLSASVPAVLAADVVETVTAADAPNGVVGVPLATFDGTATGVTLSNGNLTATHINTLSAQGARSTANKSSGKYYFEVTVGATHGGGDNAGILLSSGTYTDMTGGNNCCVAFLTFASGAIYSNNGNPSSTSLGAACVAGDIVRVCIDLTARKAWFTRNGSTVWNNRAGIDDPVTGVSAVPIASGSFAPAVQFGSGASASGDNMTANFGSTPFTYVPPSGFGNWPA
jgi:hypothetical protein